MEVYRRSRSSLKRTGGFALAVLPLASHRTLDGSAMVSLGEQLFHALSVLSEADDSLPIDHQRGRRAAFPLVHQLVVGVRICLDVLALIGDALLPKELFGGLAIPSSGLVIENDLLHRMFLLLLGRRPSRMREARMCRLAQIPLAGARRRKR